MSKFSQFISHETPWDANLSDFAGKVMTITHAEEVNNSYGRGYILTVQTVSADGEISEPLKVITSHPVVVKDIDVLVQLSDQGSDVFPIDVRVKKVRGKNNTYFMLDDPENV